MKNILEINNISKKYDLFTLNKVSFTCPEGSIMGLIGSNGAGKTTIINSILDIIKVDAGDIQIFGKDKKELTIDDKENIAVVYDENTLPEHLTSKEIEIIFEKMYKSWDGHLYSQSLDRLQIPQKVAIKDMSRGNKIKMNLSVALAHNPRLLILDEITAALDPIMRDEILKLFLEFIQDDSRSILFSSHITTDLEKIADYITFINNGNIIFSKEKDDLICNYKVVRCKTSKFDQLEKKGIIAYRKEKNSMDLIIDSRISKLINNQEVLVEEPTIEEIMLILAKGETV